MTKSIMLLTISMMAILTMILFPYAPQAKADTTNCTGFIGGFGITFDNVVVPSGSTCVLLAGTVVTGNVDVESGSVFSTFSGSVSIGGNVQADGATTVSIVCSTVNGNVHIKQSAGFQRITGSTIGGNVEIEQSSTSIIVGPSPGLGASPGCGGAGVPVPFGGGNFVGGNVKLENNITTFPANVASNTISGNLECKNNNFAPVLGPLGVLNTVFGNKVGQCAGL